MPNSKPEHILPESIAEFRQLIGRSGEKERQSIAKAVQTSYPDYRLNLTTEGRASRTAAKRLFEQRLLELLRTPIARRNDVDWSQVDAMTDLVGMRFASAPGALRPFLRSRWPKVQAQAADCFAWIGSDAILPDVVRLIRSRDLRIARGAVDGAGRAITYNWASPRFRRKVLAEMARLAAGKRRVAVTDDGRSLLGSAVGHYAEHELPRRSVLNRKECLRPANPALMYVLFQLECRRRDDLKACPLPEVERLWTLFRAVGNGRSATPRDRVNWTKATILNLTADLDAAGTRRECEALLKKSKDEPQVRKSIESAIRRCGSIPEAHDCLVWMYEHPGRLSAHAEQVLRAFETAVFVEDEGFPAYFYDGAENWRAAHAGLKLVGEAGAAAILARGARVLAPHGPPADVRRARALGVACTPAQQAGLERIGAEYTSRVVRRVTAAVERYIASHTEEFAAVR